VQLAISERLLGDDVAGAGGHLEVAIAQFPGDRLAVALLPGGEILSVEELHGIGRRRAGMLLRAGFAGRDHGGQRPAAVAGLPLDHGNGCGESGEGYGQEISDSHFAPILTLWDAGGAPWCGQLGKLRPIVNRPTAAVANRRYSTLMSRPPAVMLLTER
jgi:hypothetical protein